MKLNKKIHFFVFWFFSIFCFFDCCAQDNGQTLESEVKVLADKAKKVWNGAGNMLKVFGQGFGFVTADYYYNYHVFNDSYAPVFVAEQRLTGFMGTTFKGNIVRGSLLGPASNQEFLKSQLYITLYLSPGQLGTEHYYKTPRDFITKWGKIIGQSGLMSPDLEIAGQLAKKFGYDKIEDFNNWLGGSFGSLLGSVIGSIVNAFAKGPFAYKDELDKHAVLIKTIYPWQKNDNNVYYYRVYTDVADQKPVMKGEFLSLMGTTSEFSGQFYNSSNQDVIITFSKDNESYTVTLERDSFALLDSSTAPNSIRPASGDIRWFQFYRAQPLTDENSIAALPIASEGIAYMNDISTGGQTPTYVVGSPALYSYKVYNSSERKSGLDVAMQGLAIGNFDQPVSGKVRDINPAQCSLWYGSAAQAKATTDFTSLPFNLPEQVWITYKTRDYTYQQKVTPGAVIDFMLLRPQLAEKVASLYVVSLQTDDDKKAQKFLDRLNNGSIGQGIFHTQATLNTQNILTSMRPSLNGIINDTQGTDASGINGFILLADQYMPQGLGSGPYYYILEPSDLRVDQFASAIWFDDQFYTKDARGASVLKNDVMKDLAEKLAQWIVQYRTNPQSTTKALENYIREKANKGLFVNATLPPAQRVFTPQGNELVQTLISGPISLEQYPVLRKSGTNYYVMGFGNKPDDWPAQV